MRWVFAATLNINKFFLCCHVKWLSIKCKRDGGFDKKIVIFDLFITRQTRYINFPIFFSIYTIFTQHCIGIFFQNTINESQTISII